MGDLIEEALDDTPKEKSTVVTVDGEQIRIDKSHISSPMNESYWEVSVNVADQYGSFSDVPDERESSLDAEEADDLYTELVEKYDERDNVFKSLAEMDEVDDETLKRIKEIAGRNDAESDESEERDDMWCRECATKAKYGPPIGHYCPNKGCEVGDGPELVNSKSKTKDQDIGREVTAEDCDECGGTLRKSSSTVHAPGFASSFRAECVDCGHKQEIPAW